MSTPLTRGPARIWSVAGGLLVLGAAVLTLTGCVTSSPVSASTASATAAGASRSSGDGPLTVTSAEVPSSAGDLGVEVCVPRTPGPHAVVLLIHGGSYAQGADTDLVWLCREAAAHGFAGFSLSYRFLPTHYPAQLQDLAAQLHWIRAQQQAQRFQLDVQHVAVIGASSGAALAAEMLTDVPGWPGPTKAFTAGVLLSGAYGLAPGVLPPDLARANLGYLGCASYSPCAASASASASEHVRSNDPPMLLVNSADELMPEAEATGFAAALQAVRAPHRLIIVPGTDHAEAIPEHSSAVDREMWDFIAAAAR